MDGPRLTGAKGLKSWAGVRQLLLCCRGGKVASSALIICLIANLAHVTERETCREYNGSRRDRERKSYDEEREGRGLRQLSQ